MERLVLGDSLLFFLEPAVVWDLDQSGLRESFSTCGLEDPDPETTNALWHAPPPNFPEWGWGIPPLLL